MIVEIVRPKGWRPSGTHTGGCSPEPIWRPCPHCWGQGRILEQRPGDIWFAETCPRCLGVATVPSERR